MIIQNWVYPTGVVIRYIQTLSVMTIQNWVYPTGVVIRYLQTYGLITQYDCENCSQTSSKREHLKNHNKSQHQCHLNKASSCWRKYLYLRSNKEVIIKLSYPHCFFSYSAIQILINENSSKTVFY